MVLDGTHLDRGEVGIVEVAQEPEDAGSEHFPEQNDERCEVINVNHAEHPVDEERCAGRGLEARLAVLQGRVEHRETAQVEPPAADQGKDADLHHRQQRNLHHDVTKSEDPPGPLQFQQLGDGVELHERNADDAVTGQRRHQSVEVQLLDAEKGDEAVADGVRDEGEDEDEQRVERDDPEDVLQEHHRAVQTQQSLPRQLKLRTVVELHRIPNSLVGVVVVGVVGLDGGLGLIVVVGNRRLGVVDGIVLRDLLERRQLRTDQRLVSVLLRREPKIRVHHVVVVVVEVLFVAIRLFLLRLLNVVSLWRRSLSEDFLVQVDPFVSLQPVRSAAVQNLLAQPNQADEGKQSTRHDEAAAKNVRGEVFRREHLKRKRHQHVEGSREEEAICAVSGERDDSQPGD